MRVAARRCAGPLLVLAALAGCGFAEEPLRPAPEVPLPPAAPAPPPPAPAPLCFAQTGALREARSGFGAALLEDGRVLVAGGMSPEREALRAAELYDPATELWTAAAPMGAPRVSPAAVRLQDGRILVAGGWIPGGAFGGAETYHATAELFDPATGTWSAAAPMLRERAAPTALRLADGRVLLSFGVVRGNVNSLELYDPALDAWTELTDPPWMGTLAGAPALLPDGRPFFASSLLSASYEPATGTWQHLASKQGPRREQLWAFPDGRVLAPNSDYDGTGELYSPATDSWTRTGGYLQPRSEWHTFAPLQDGRLLLAGGSDSAYEAPLGGAELFDPDTGSWTYGGRMAWPRRFHVLVTLRDGRVLAAGGSGARDWPLTAELFDPTCPGPR